MATDQLTHRTANALCELLAARVEAERMPGNGQRRAGYKGTSTEAERRAMTIADLELAIEHGTRALALAKNAAVIPLPLPRVAAEAA